MSAFSENKSFCTCVGEKDKKLTCLCGETDYEPVWKWDENVKTPTTIISQNRQKVYFHKGYSVGNACVRGDTPFVNDYDYYWEIKMLSSVYGTSMMVGVGTENFNINQANERFCNLIGCDSESWGMKFTGSLHHNNTFKNYNTIAGFTMGSIIGVHLNMWNGTLEYYLNRIPLGVAFIGLRNKILYPLISSTASHTVMKLIFAHSEPHSLSLMSAKYLNQKSLGDLPPGLKLYNKTCWWLFPKSSRLKPDKKFDLLPSLYPVDLLADSDDDEDDITYLGNGSIFAHKVKKVLDPSNVRSNLR
ncbi:hypothetical protein RUM44_008183 [Polyplax serrata]|uniref:B30.2/SPRY domain-containing protein n=1 Tax=Polyplax serrata TaxID=468196 RepID=A0ABR1B7T4_POLSC